MYLNSPVDSELITQWQKTHSYINSAGSRLEMLAETWKFLKASHGEGNVELFHDRLQEVANILNIQRIILYKVSGALAEVILSFWNPIDTPQVTEISKIYSNPNLFNAVHTGKASNIPRDWAQIDAAFPIWRNGIILGVDTTNSARVFTRSEIIFLEFIAGAIVSAYDAGKAIHKLGVDSLTGLWNRRALDTIIDEEKDIFGLPAPKIQWVAFMDIDHFKQVNDTHGHAIGDKVLKRVGGILNDNMKVLWGRAFRYGWEEFVGLLSNEVSRDNLEQIRLDIQEDTLVIDSLKLKVTISIGLALKKDISPSLIEKNGSCANKWYTQIMAKFADKALYRAKNQGRNQVVTWPFE